MKRPVFWRDCLIATSIVLTVLAVAAVLWWRAPIRQAVSQTASRNVPPPPDAAAVPDGFDLAWSKPNAASASPMVVGGVLVTADGGSLVGWEVASGKEVWRFAEPTALCAATAAWGKVYAVYREPRGCSLVVSLDAKTGKRSSQLHADARSSEADQQVRLITTVPAEGTDAQEAQADPSSDWYSHMVLAVGSRRVELWHDDLLRSVEYGRAPTPFEPKQQPHPGCALRSAAMGQETFAVLEHCPHDGALRLSFLKISPKKDTKPEQTFSAVVSELGFAKDARLLAVRGSRALLSVPPADGSAAKIMEVDGHGKVEQSYDLTLPVTGQDAQPWRTSAVLTTWWTGAGVVGLSPLDLAPVFQVPDLAGPATEMARQLVAPTATGIAVLDANTGERLREIPTDGAALSPSGVHLAVCGSIVLRQQGGRVLAYAPRR
ncbi:MAG: Rv3212 family protein [Segniliparus sp.]|uniref:Rv3212 family protein n=1 Tax=Segniliparus sp. TaxID=2804064 RepID=UPI003F2C1A38